ncbi:hypothetical protein [Levilactobacillus suantsaii]|uniref:Uncharacterized protein n=1 Tax=Levilactobacillus suantsaii TaxID=2292255 RepID=A0A4Q0VK52_9LACO|nr:hypothetical protein [Levilactobacillus suantsaii]QMU07190.1 hypothetical protein H3M12_06705 [Levilactobacillus suantsaii]RXI80037.1 hypothetical protein DXH47_00275 [Levilactobacillus suantsaii]
MLDNQLSEEKRKFQMLTWRAQKHGTQVVTHDQMQQFTATIAEQEAIMLAAKERRTANRPDWVS